MKAFRLALLASAVLLAPTTLAFSQECAKEPVTVGFLPKLDTDPYFKVAFGGAEEAAKEIGGTATQVARSRLRPRRRSNSSTASCRRRSGLSQLPATTPMPWRLR